MKPSRDLDKVMVRMPDGMRAAIQSRAARERRSANAEIVLMLERALAGELAAGSGPEKAAPAAERNDARQSVATATHA